MSRFEGAERYVATEDLKIAVNAAIALERPLLIKGEPGTGKTVLAYEVAKALDVPQNTMSVHLATLARAGLIRSERRSRIINYRADLDQLKALTLFLVKDCCGGRPEICAPLIADLSPCCPPQTLAAKEAAHD